MLLELVLHPSTSFMCQSRAHVTSYDHGIAYMLSQRNRPTGVAFKLIIALVYLNRSSLVCMPVCNYDGEVIGVAQIMNKREGSDDSSAGVGHQFTETDLKVAECT